MGADEEGTLARLKAHRKELIDPKIAEHHGRIVKTTGDGMLVEFASVVDAVRCAGDVQQRMSERNADVPQEQRIEFRIGINLGDIIVDGEDIHGDGVNIAARLEGIAEPGGICVSEDAYRQVRGKVGHELADAGEQSLKNIAKPVRVYRLLPARRVSAAATLALPSKPSIAVLPFQNMSGDPEQEYFADGIVEEIITALSRIRWLFVIARNSSFTYKGQAADIKHIGSELGVRYVLEGSVRKAGKRVRITGQLIDATTGAHLWADKFDGALEDVFDLQDQVTASVVGVVAPKLQMAEIERAGQKPTQSLDAYDYFLRGMAAFHLVTRDGTDRALVQLARAIELDPHYASAHGVAAWCYQRRKAFGWCRDTEREAGEGKRLAWRAVELSRDDPVALYSAGFAIAYLTGDLESGSALIQRALALNPNEAVAWTMSGWVQAWLNEPETAIEHLHRAMRLNPLDPFSRFTESAMTFAHFTAGRYDEAILWAGKTLREHPDHLTSLRIGAAAYALRDRLEEARRLTMRLRELHPQFRISAVPDIIPARDPPYLSAYIEGLRKAGLPE